jgi:hypothetical protein
MSLANVWLDTLGDGLIRADAIIGVRTHPTPVIAGKLSRWLLDVVLAAPTGSGLTDSWALGPLHRTLIQTDRQPLDAPQQLVRLLAQLDATNAAGIVTTSGGPAPTSNPTGSKRAPKPPPCGFATRHSPPPKQAATTTPTTSNLRPAP